MYFCYHNFVFFSRGGCGLTALMYMIKNHYEDHALELIQMGSDINILTRTRESAMFCAISFGQNKVRILICFCFQTGFVLLFGLFSRVLLKLREN